MKYVLLFSWVFLSTVAAAQRVYTTANAHAHNDYEHPHPFQTAYDYKFGSIEVDIFLSNDSLLVGHTTADLARHRTLQSLYLDPLRKEIERHGGYPYSDTTLSLQLLVDLKTQAIATLKKLMQVLEAFPTLIQCRKLQIVITGNRPSQELFTKYPSWIFFDGELHLKYSPEALSRIVMLSDDFTRYSHWNAKDRLEAEDLLALQAAVAKAHQSGKKVRFWNAPDYINVWEQFVSLDVDYINTDHIEAIAAFFPATSK